MQTYRFGSTSIAFDSRDQTWLSFLGERYASFRDRNPHDVFRLHFECTAPSAPDGLTSPLSTYVEAPTIDTNAHGFTATTATTFADVDLDARRARLRGPRALYPVDNLFRHLLPALGEQGVLVHGAALAKRGRGVLACGPSGAGKSTLARLAGERALCDELAAVYADDDGYRLESLPFWNARPGSADLTAILLLHHGREHRAEPVPRANALRRITQQVLWPVELPVAMDRALGHVASLVAAVPVFELWFRPEPNVWGFIEEQFLS